MSDTTNSLASFTPVTITAETIGILRQQKHFADLLALYMAYAEVSVWQKTTTVRSTTGFMADRMGWEEKKLRSRKAELRELGLIKDVTRYDDKRRATGWYVQVNYVVNPENIHPSDFGVGGNSHRVESPTPSAVNTSLSTVDSKLSTEPSDKSEVLPKVTSPIAARSVEDTHWNDGDDIFELRPNDVAYAQRTLERMFGCGIIEADSDIALLRTLVARHGRKAVLAGFRAVRKDGAEFDLSEFVGECDRDCGQGGNGEGCFFTDTQGSSNGDEAWAMEAAAEILAELDANKGARHVSAGVQANVY